MIMNHRRVPEDDVREGFFTNEILKAAAAIGERIVLVLCSAPVCRTQKSSHVSRRPGTPGGSPLILRKNGTQPRSRVTVLRFSARSAQRAIFQVFSVPKRTINRSKVQADPIDS